MATMPGNDNAEGWHEKFLRLSKSQNGKGTGALSEKNSDALLRDVEDEGKHL